MHITAIYSRDSDMCQVASVHNISGVWVVLFSTDDHIL